MHGFYALRAVWLLGAAVVLGCGGDGPTEPDISAGSLSFTYAGAMSGAFDVTGALGPGSGGRPPDGAGAFRSATSAKMLVAARHRRSATRADFFDLFLPAALAPGTLTLGEESCFPVQTSCATGFMGLDLSLEPPVLGAPPPDGFFMFIRGTITITSVSERRLSGTFAGTAETIALWPETPRVITVTNGKFDVPISTPPVD